jgi:hypothetical protein
MARYRKFKETAEPTAESKSQCIKLQLKGMIETLYMRHVTDPMMSFPMLVSSACGVPVGVAMIGKDKRWYLYVTIGEQGFELVEDSLYMLYNSAMKELS